MVTVFAEILKLKILGTFNKALFYWQKMLRVPKFLSQYGFKRTK